MIYIKFFNETEQFYFDYKGEKHCYFLTETDFGEWKIECDLEEFRTVFGGNILQKQESLSNILEKIGVTFPVLKNQMEIPFLIVAKEAISNYGKLRKANFLRN